ncbi:MAG: helix-turn-helix domain-containing protein [Clostridia bacterium]|nr:helix-turn-helix domain-containing protein [Clostridia bacterium]
MSIGSTIKRLRREKNITQEQLAEYLGITSRAISQWECDRTAPDISQLPALCHIFDVSSDLLLGIDIEKNNEEIKKYLTEAAELGNQGKSSERTALLREANKRFPRDYKIMERLANAIVCEYSRKGIKEYDEVFDLCNRILSECTDSNIRYVAVETLGVAYDYAGKKDEMLKLAEEMPRARFSYENFMVYRWEGNEAVKERQKYIEFLLHELLSMITCLSGHRGDDGKMIFSWGERKELRKLELDLVETFFPDGDYQYFAQYAEMVCSFFVTDAFGEKDYEKAWYWLNRGADFAIHGDTYDFNAPHTSPILSGYSDGGWIMEAEGNHSQSMLDWLTTDTSENVAALRSDARYETLVDRLKKVAKKP